MTESSPGPVFANVPRHVAPEGRESESLSEREADLHTGTRVHSQRGVGPARRRTSRGPTTSDTHEAAPQFDDVDATEADSQSPRVWVLEAANRHMVRLVDHPVWGALRNLRDSRELAAAAAATASASPDYGQSAESQHCPLRSHFLGKDTPSQKMRASGGWFPVWASGRECPPTQNRAATCLRSGEANLSRRRPVTEAVVAARQKVDGHHGV
jgi:hypothetical protein